MKKFEVEFKKISWMTIEVEAENKDDAENKAYEYLERERILNDAIWEIESMGEVK
jgi:hypothetical protein